jgi:hypothetical protein
MAYPILNALGRRAARSIGHVIMKAPGVIHAIPAAAYRRALKADDLHHHAHRGARRRASRSAAGGPRRDQTGIARSARSARRTCGIARPSIHPHSVTERLRAAVLPYDARLLSNDDLRAGRLCSRTRSRTTTRGNLTGFIAVHY